MKSKPHVDKSQNHTFSINYKTKSFLQIIRRIPVPQEPIETILKVEHDVNVEKERGDHADSSDYIEINGTRYKREEKRVREQSPEYVEVDGARYKKVKIVDIPAIKVKEEILELRVKEEVVPFKEVDGVIEID
jgi:hypothetical protein